MRPAEEIHSNTGVPLHPDYVKKMSDAGFRCYTLEDIKAIQLEARTAKSQPAETLTEKMNKIADFIAGDFGSSSTPPTKEPAKGGTPRSDACGKAIEDYWNDPSTPRDLRESMDGAKKLLTPLKLARTLELELQELRGICEGLIAAQLDSKYGHMICACDYGCDGRLPLRGEVKPPNVSDQRPGDRDATKNKSSGIAGFAASDG